MAIQARNQVSQADILLGGLQVGRRESSIYYITLLDYIYISIYYITIYSIYTVDAFFSDAVRMHLAMIGPSSACKKQFLEPKSRAFTPRCAGLHAAYHAHLQGLPH